MRPFPAGRPAVPPREGAPGEHRGRRRRGTVPSRTAAGSQPQASTGATGRGPPSWEPPRAGAAWAAASRSLLPTPSATSHPRRRSSSPGCSSPPPRCLGRPIPGRPGREVAPCPEAEQPDRGTLAGRGTGTGKKVERRERNREHAKRSRIRKKFLLESLQQSVSMLKEENETLRRTPSGRSSGNEADELVKQGEPGRCRGRRGPHRRFLLGRQQGPRRS